MSNNLGCKQPQRQRASCRNPLERRGSGLPRRCAPRNDGGCDYAAAREWLADKGYDPAYGARPLKRVIQKAVQDPLAELILSGKIKDGEKVVISAGKQGLVFNGAAVAAAA